MGARTSTIAGAALLCCLAAIPALAQKTDLPPKFFLGADTSALDAPTRWPLPPYQEDGKPSDENTILMHHGWTAFRVRVFVSPVRNAPDNTLENAIPLARKIKSAGAILILDLHFSDTWADPQHQEVPVAWRGLDFDQLTKQWQRYAHDTIRTLKDAGAMPDIVQIGNEITRGTAWPLAQLQVPGSSQYNPPAPYDEALQWKRLTRLLKAGIRGVKSGAGDTPPRIAIHIDKGGHWDTTEWFFDHLNAAHVHYDIIAESFYPPWGHGTLEELRNNMQECARRYHKDFLVMETGYTPPHAPTNQDMLWPVTPQGRLQFMVDLVNTVRKAPRGLGVLYWAPEHDLWNADGSPAPAVFTLDNLTTLATGPASHAPAAATP
ncbi:MAG: glycosyl hydrolase 53 family protein [Acidobacteriaceae bacterium]